MTDVSPREAELAAHYTICGTDLRERDRDLWLACLYAPEPKRKHAHAIHAFAAEIREIAHKVSQPTLGEMRLRWWLDTLTASGEGARAHPLADALQNTISTCGLDESELCELLEARSADLYDDRMHSTEALIEYCRRVAARPLWWSAQCLGCENAGPSREAIELAGIAMGLTDVARGLAAGRDRQFAPLDMADRNDGDLRPVALHLASLAEARYKLARARWGELSEPARIAVLPAARTPLFWEQLRTGSSEPAAWRRQWRLWRAARRGL